MPPKRKALTGLSTNFGSHNDYPAGETPRLLKRQQLSPNLPTNPSARAMATIPKGLTLLDTGEPASFFNSKSLNPLVEQPQVPSQSLSPSHPHVLKSGKMRRLERVDQGDVLRTGISHSVLQRICLVNHTEN
jgi:hypothetical protein